MRRASNTLIALVLCLSLSGCIGTVLQTPSPKVQQPESTMSVTLLWGLKPSYVEAKECSNGVASATTVWPIWGAIVAYLTILLVVPTYTSYTCSAR